MAETRLLLRPTTVRISKVEGVRGGRDIGNSLPSAFSPHHFPRTERWGTVATTMVDTSELVQAIAGEMAFGVETAVECWMAEIERVLEDPQLTTLGRLHGVGEILGRYKHLSGKTRLECRRG
jgi:hypothetical protein